MKAIRNLARFALKHPLGGRTPLRTFARIASWQIQSRLRSGVHDREWIEGAHLLVGRGMTGATGNLYYGLHEFADMGFLLHFLRPGDLMIDVGANIGSYTVLAARVVGASVIAIEPHPVTADRLEANVARNAVGDKVSVLRMALSDAPGVGNLTSDRDTMNQLVAADSETSAGVTVSLDTLDNVVGSLNPTMLKIDVEGHERAVFSGAAQTLAKPSLRALEVETVDAAIREQIVAAGFSELHYDPFTRSLTEAHNGLRASNRLFVRDAVTVIERVKTARKFRVGGFSL